MQVIPLILDQAKSPTVLHPGRKPTFKMDMEVKSEGEAAIEIPLFTQNQAQVVNIEPPVVIDTCNDYSEDMEVGCYEELATSPPAEQKQDKGVEVVLNLVDAPNYITEGQEAVDALQQAYPPEPGKFEIELLNSSIQHLTSFSSRQGVL